MWGTPADEASGSRPTTPPPLQLTAGPSSGQPQPTAVAHGQIMHHQRFPVSAAPGAQYPGMMMSYFPGQVSPMPMPMPVTMQMGQQGPTIYQHGGPAPNQFIQTSGESAAHKYAVRPVERKKIHSEQITVFVFGMSMSTFFLLSFFPSQWPFLSISWS